MPRRAGQEVQNDLLNLVFLNFPRKRLLGYSLFGLPIRANHSRQRNGLCVVAVDETKNENVDLLLMNQSETVKQAGHP